jgi:hypothetical protein
MPFDRDRDPLLVIWEAMNLLAEMNMYLDAPQIKKLLSDVEGVVCRLTMELAMRANSKTHSNLTKSHCIKTRSDFFLQPQSGRKSQRQKTANVTTAAMSHGTMFQYAIDLGLRCWIRRSACCRSRSVLSKKRCGTSADMDAHPIVMSPGGDYLTPLLSISASTIR